MTSSSKGTQPDRGDLTVRFGCSSASLPTRWISVATPMTDPSGAASTARMIASVEPTMSASSHDIVRTLRVHDHDPFGMFRPERRDLLRPEPLMDRAVSLPEDEGRFFERPLVVAPEIASRVPDHHVRLGPSELVPGVAPEVLVREEEDLVRPRAVRLVSAPGREPSAAPRVRSRMCTPTRRGGRRKPSERPPSSCRSPAVSARCLSPPPAPPRLPPPSRYRPCPPSSSRRSGRGGSPAGASPVRTSADSAMKWTPQNTTNSASAWSAAIRESPNESPRASANLMTSSRW